MESRTTSQPLKSKKESWSSWRDLRYLNSLYHRGIIATQPCGYDQHSSDEANPISQDNLPIGNRTFSFFKKRETTSRSKYFEKPFQLLKEINANLPGQDSVALYNQARREEVFFPVELNDGKGIYLHPSISGQLQPFTGFEAFVTCGCLFGSNLQGQDNAGYQIALIKHDIKFHPGQMITQINYNPKSACPYETMLFAEFKKYIAFIDQFSSQSTPKQLFYHLPYYDYMLFGVELYTRGRMTKNAFHSLCKIIVDKAVEQKKRIMAICRAHNISVTVTSPFDNLLGPLTKDGNIADAIFHLFELKDTVSKPSSTTMPDTQQDERDIIQRCLMLLRTHDHNPDHREVWEDFISVTESDAMNTIEDLFKAGNAVMLGIAGKGKAPHKVCSLLPLTEKQIQLSYDAYVNVSRWESKVAQLLQEKKSHETKLARQPKEPQPDDSIPVNPTRVKIDKLTEEIEKARQQLEKHQRLTGKYPALFNAIILDSLVTYDPSTRGLLYYATSCSSTLDALINDRVTDEANLRIVTYAARVHKKNKLLEETLATTTDDSTHIDTLFESEMTSTHRP